MSEQTCAAMPECVACGDTIERDEDMRCEICGSNPLCLLCWSLECPGHKPNTAKTKPCNCRG